MPLRAEIMTGAVELFALVNPLCGGAVLEGFAVTHSISSPSQGFYLLLSCLPGHSEMQLMAELTPWA